jgi:predicted ATP-grasp superfamily ATP-dependent carboligase
MLPLTEKDKLQGVERVLQKHRIIVILVNPFIDGTLPLTEYSKSSGVGQGKY